MRRRESLMGLSPEEQAELYRSDRWLTAWLVLTLLAAMAVIVGLLMFYVYAWPISGGMTEVPKSASQFMPHPRSDPVVMPTSKLEI